MYFRRLLFILLSGVCLGALLYSGRAVFFYILVFLLSVLLLSAVEIIMASFSFRIESERESSYPNKNENFSHRLIVRSIFFPVLHIRIDCRYGHTTNLIREKRIYHVFATKTHPARLDIPMVSNYAGLFEFRVSSVELYDFLGFFRYSVPLRKRFPENPVQIPVLPNIRRFSRAPRVFSELIPPMRKTNERSENVGGREYRPGDDFRTVNWKRTAKTGVLYIKEYEKGTQDFHLLYIDLTRPIVAGEESTITSDRLLAQAADLCAFLLREQRPVNLLSFSENGEEQCGILHGGSLEKAKLYLSTRSFVDTVPEEYKDRLSSIWEIGKNSLSVFSSALTPEPLSFLSRFSGDLATVTLFIITQKGHEDRALSVCDYYARMGVHCFRIGPRTGDDEEGAR
ncbi:MAG: DUF58 domain-containing protein [Clostridiaceae bacterium]|mgnify:CR=1 FL=1|nr:DUF58 domain-containing protein [Clostridiaceae bacterium]